MSDEAVQLFLRPFVNELVRGNEDRLSSQIESRIFVHLIRQSDIAIAYEEDDEEMEEDEESYPEKKDGMDKDESIEDEEEALFCLDDADPRAGKGDVTIPQIHIDYENMGRILIEAGSKKEVL